MYSALKINEITIIGAGPVGLMCAFYALNYGYKVTLITLPLQNAKTAGMAAGGMLAPAYEFFENNSELECEFAINARNEWNIFSKNRPIKIDKSALALANDEKDIIKLEKIKEVAKKFDLEFEYIKTPEFINAKTALALKTDALINPQLVTNFLQEYIIKNGGNFIFDEIIEINNDEIIGKENNYKFEKIIIANGYEAKKFANNIEILNCLKPVRGQTIEIDFKPEFIGSIRYQNTYLMARENKIIIGATSQEGNDNWEVKNDDSLLLKNNAINIFPSLENKKILRSFCGIRPMAKSDLPAIGASKFENIYLAIGAYRNGWAFSPLMAKLLIDEISQKSPIPNFLLPV